VPEEAAKRTNTRPSNAVVEFKRVKEGTGLHLAGRRRARKCGVSEYGRVAYFERD